MSGFAYEDIVGLPHHVSATRPQMSRENRAAQFAPFAALTGHGAAVEETARLTEQQIELSDGAIADLELKLNMLANMIDEQPEVTITHFQLDEKKDGGAYITTTGVVKKIDGYEHAIVLLGGKRVSISSIRDIRSEIFGGLE